MLYRHVKFKIRLTLKLLENYKIDCAVKIKVFGQNTYNNKPGLVHRINNNISICALLRRKTLYYVSITRPNNL